MKAVFALLALTMSALARTLAPGWNNPEGTITSTTYTTTTYCPITSAETKLAAAVIFTAWITSTVTLTSCVGDHAGPGGFLTVSGPTGLPTSTTKVFVTYTTTFSVTDTLTVSGSITPSIYTTISVAETAVPTTYHAAVAIPQYTSVESEACEMYTTVSPVTQAMGIIGQGITGTDTYTTTSIVSSHIPSTIQEYTLTRMTTCIELSYETSSLRHSITDIEAFYITLGSRSTITIREILTSTIQITSWHASVPTSELPTTEATIYVSATLSTTFPETEVITVPSEIIMRSREGGIYTSVAAPMISTFTGPPSTPTTIIPFIPNPTIMPSLSNSTTSARLQVSYNTTATKVPTTRATALLGSA